jgi:hypothetical protein
MPGIGNAEQRMIARSVQDRKAGHESAQPSGGENAQPDGYFC